MRESRAERPRRFDLFAQVLVITALFALTSAVIDGRAVFSEEVVWDPRGHADPGYHRPESPPTE